MNIDFDGISSLGESAIAIGAPSYASNYVTNYTGDFAADVDAILEDLPNFGVEESDEIFITGSSKCYISAKRSSPGNLFYQCDEMPERRFKFEKDSPLLKQCYACHETKPGVEWKVPVVDDILTLKKKVTIHVLCYQCMLDTALYVRAKQSWVDNNGDPVSQLRTEVEELNKKVAALEKYLL